MNEYEDDRPLPNVGDHVRRYFGPKNPNTWKRWGVVRGIVDEQIVVRVLSSREGFGAVYILIDPDSWCYLSWERWPPV